MSVNREITQPQKTKEIHLTVWNSRSIANSVKSILCTKKPGRVDVLSIHVKKV